MNSEPIVKPFVPDPGIWILTVMYQGPAGTLVRKRTWGYFRELEVAVRAVVDNDGDIYEDGAYNFALLARVPWGTLGIPDEERWFAVAYDRPARTYAVDPTYKPAELEGVCSFWNS